MATPEVGDRVDLNMVTAFSPIISDNGKSLSGGSGDAVPEQYFQALNQLLAYEASSAEKANAFTAEQNRLANEFTASQNKQAQEFSAQQAALDRAFQQSSADKAMQFSADQAAINRQWQTEMSNSAYSRAMSDLKNAGVNPLLAVTAGQSSTPSVGNASGFSSAGRAASGYSGSGRAGSGIKANAASIVSSVVSMINQQSANSAKMVSSAMGLLGDLYG